MCIYSCTLEKNIQYTRSKQIATSSDLEFATNTKSPVFLGSFIVLNETNNE